MARGGYNSRTAWATSASASMDRARAADQLERTLEDAGYDVTRQVHATEVVIVLEWPSGIPGLVNECVYRGPTALDALRLAVSDRINEAVSE